MLDKGFIAGVGMAIALPIAAEECKFSLSLTNYSNLDSNIVLRAKNIDESAHRLDKMVLTDTNSVSSSTNSYSKELKDYYKQVNEFNKALGNYITNNGTLGRGATPEGKSYSFSEPIGSNSLNQLKFDLFMHIGELKGALKAYKEGLPESQREMGFDVVRPSAPVLRL